MYGDMKGVIYLVWCGVGVGWGVSVFVSHLDLRIAVSYSLHLDQLCVPMLTTIYLREWLFSYGLGNAVIYQYNNKPLEVSLILCPFSKIIAGG